MTRLERLLYTLAAVLLPSPRGHHHRPVPAKSIQDDAPTVAFPALTSHPYPSQETR